MNAKLGGKVSLDQKINFDFNVDIPKNKLGKNASAVLEKLLGNLNKFGLSANLPNIIKMKFKITGDYNNPIITPVIAGYEGKDTKEIVTQMVTDKVNETIDKTKEKARIEAQKQADSLIKQARLKAAALNKIAQEQADKIVAEAKELSAKLKAAAKKQGAAAIKKAGNNPIKAIAANELAKQLNKQAKKKGDKLVETAKKKGKALIDSANHKGENIIALAQKEGDKRIQNAIK